MKTLTVMSIPVSVEEEENASRAPDDFIPVAVIDPEVSLKPWGIRIRKVRDEKTKELHIVVGLSVPHGWKVASIEEDAALCRYRVVPPPGKPGRPVHVLAGSRAPGLARVMRDVLRDSRSE